MSLNPITPGLRHMRNKSNDVAKVSIVVPAGDELEVSGYVADQLLGQTQAFEAVGSLAGVDEGQAGEPSADSPAGPVFHPEDGIVEEAGGGTARGKSGRRK